MTRTWDETEDEAAALWVARQLGGMVDATAFDTWLAGAPGRRARFDTLWATCMDPAVTDALARDECAREAPAKARRIPAKAAIGAAGAVAAALALAWFSPAIRFLFTPAQDYATQAGEMRTVALEDGSSVVLSGASAIRVRLAPGRREVELTRGEAFFTVEHDADRPFSVTAGDSRATVLGTRFDVALGDDRADLAVEDGIVRFSSRSDDDQSVLVKAGSATALDHGRLQSLTAIAGQPVAAWRQGWFEAEDIPLNRLVAELQRWSSTPIRIADPVLGQKRVAGRFRLTNPAQQLENLASLHGFTLRREADAYVLSKP